MKSAEKIAKNTWDRAWKSRSGVDFSTDIQKTGDREARSTRYFNNLNAKCALLLLAKTIEPNETNDKLLGKLYEEGIREEEITNPALKVTYHYYSENKAKDDQLDKMAEQQSRTNEQLRYYKSRMEWIERKYNGVIRLYQNLQNKFKARIDSDEQNYKKALEQIETLRGKLDEVQNTGIFKTIGSKLKALLGNKREELPAPKEELPSTLYKNPAEKMGIMEPGQNELDELEKDGIEAREIKGDIKRTQNIEGWQH